MCLNLLFRVDVKGCSKDGIPITSALNISRAAKKKKARCVAGFLHLNTNIPKEMYLNKPSLVLVPLMHLNKIIR